MELQLEEVRSLDRDVVCRQGPGGGDRTERRPSNLVSIFLFSAALWLMLGAAAMAIRFLL